MFKIIFGGLCLGLVAIILFVQSSITKSDRMTVVDAYQQSTQGQLLLVDIRSQNEWKKTGIAPQALALSMHGKNGLKGFSKHLAAALNGDKNKPIGLICGSGMRSLYLQHYLVKQGFTQVFNISEGMVGSVFSDGWIDQGLPTETYLIPKTLNTSYNP